MKYIKIILAAALALTMTACSDTNTSELTTAPIAETTESVTTVSKEATVDTEATTSETEETTTAEVTTVSETEEETVSKTVLDIEQNIKDAINDFGGQITYSTLFFTDLNKDGIDEMIILEGLGPDGYTEIYDVSEKAELLTSFCGRHFNTDNDTVNWEYSDENGETHYIMRVDVYVSSDSYYSGYYDITYIDGKINLEIPLLGLPHIWYDNGAFMNGWYLYSDCLYDKSVGKGMIVNFPFKTKNNEVIIEYPDTRTDVDGFIGEYPIEDFDFPDTDEINAIIDEKVFSGMTFVKDIDTVVYTGTDEPKNSEEYYEVIRDEIMKQYS